MRKRMRKAVSMLLLFMLCGMIFTGAPLSVMAEDEIYFEVGVSFDDEALPDSVGDEAPSAIIDEEFPPDGGDQLAPPDGDVDSVHDLEGDPASGIVQGDLELEIEEEIDAVMAQAFDDIVLSLAAENGESGGFLAPIDAPAADSIPISNRAELEAINDNLSGNYHLTADIDLSGDEWVPIGDNSTETDDSRFTGIFDGQGHLIRYLTITGNQNGYASGANLTIYTKDYQYAGLFGAASGATIKNVGLEDSSISTNISASSYSGAFACVGSICGVSYDSTISNCYNIGSVSAFSSYSVSNTGGICGASSSTISNCYNIGSVSATSSDYDAYAGGICGFSYVNSINKCYNSGSVFATSSDDDAYAGGICGSSISPAINDCYNTGSVSATSFDYDAYAGGICGRSSSSIDDCYNIGSVSASTTTASHYTHAGGICGYLYEGFSINNCYNISSVSASSFDTVAHVGGICGYRSYSSSISNYYWMLESDQIVNSASRDAVEKKGVGSDSDTSTGRLTDEEMKDQANFTGFDFDAIWDIDISSEVNGGYPFLRDLPPGNGGDNPQTPVITITTHPAIALGVKMGSISGSLSVVASVTQGATLSYQWYSNTSSSNTGGAAITGATNATFAIPTDLAAGIYFYFCEISATGGATVRRTNVTTLIVIQEGYGTNGKFLAPIVFPGVDSIAISNRAELEAIKDNLNGNYYLTADIDLSGGEWVPIGDNSTETDDSRFTGTFDGQGHVIRNLTITGNQNDYATGTNLIIYAKDYQYAGLFGFTDGATITNTGLENLNIDIANSSYETQVGGICGYSIDSSISNCYNTGSVFASSAYFGAAAGGICGFSASFINNCYNTGPVYVASFASSTSYNYTAVAGGICGNFSFSGSINNCYNTGSVTASISTSAVTTYAGGICGLSSSAPPFVSSISNCYNTGSISAFSAFQSNAYAGGICGISASSINNCYNTGSVTASSALAYAISNSYAYAGGICGASGSSISNCYNTGPVTANTPSISSAYAGGICGACYLGSSVSNCYWMLECDQIAASYISRDDEDKRGVGNEEDTTTGRLSSEEMKVADNYVGWDFSTVWDISPAVNDGYPYLKDLYPGDGIAVIPGDVSGDGSINMQDVLLIYQHFRGKAILTGSVLDAADVNADGDVNMQDVLMVYQYFRGKITEFLSQ